MLASTIVLLICLAAAVRIRGCFLHLQDSRRALLPVERGSGAEVPLDCRRRLVRHRIRLRAWIHTVVLRHGALQSGQWASGPA